MRGVLCQWTETKLVDVTHELPRQNIRASAFWLREVLPYFPPAVHLAVIDPGVGTDRAAVVVRAGEHALVGPDNGVLIPVAEQLGDGEFDIFRIQTQDEKVTGPDRTAWPPRQASTTFHGRDVFAPAAGKVHETDLDHLEQTEGFEATEEYVHLEFPAPTIGTNEATGTIIAVDGFGNAITNIPGTAVTDLFGSTVRVNGESAPVREMYAAVDPGERLVTVGSHGNVELAVNQGRGDDAFGISSAENVALRW